MKYEYWKWYWRITTHHVKLSLNNEWVLTCRNDETFFQPVDGGSRSCFYYTSNLAIFVNDCILVFWSIFPCNTDCYKKRQDKNIEWIIFVIFQYKYGVKTYHSWDLLKVAMVTSVSISSLLAYVPRQIYFPESSWFRSLINSIIPASPGSSSV